MTVLWAIKREVKLRNEPMSNGIGTHRDLVHSQRTGHGPDLRSLGMRFEIEGVVSRLTLDNMGRNAVGGPHFQPFIFDTHLDRPPFTVAMKNPLKTLLRTKNKPPQVGTADERPSDSTPDPSNSGAPPVHSFGCEVLFHGEDPIVAE